jgi:hypothetical protein
MELLRSLIGKSLVLVVDRDEEVRYWLLESVRIYAEGKLVEAGESEHLRSSHRDFYLEWIESLPFDQLRTALGRSPLVDEADNLTASLEWCRQQYRYDLCARIAVRMSSYWYSFARTSEMMAWWQELNASLPPNDGDHRAMAFLLRSRTAGLTGEFDVLDEYSAQASALADPHSWVGVEARYLQAIYCSMIDPPRGNHLFEQAFEIDASMGVAPDPVYFQTYYLSRLRRADGLDEARAVLDHLRTDLRDSTPTPFLAAVFALYGDARTALELMSRIRPADLPMRHLVTEFSKAVLASAQGEFDQAEQHLATFASLVRAHAVAPAEAGCLIGFAKIAVDRGDFVRASSLLAAVDSSISREDRPVGFGLEDLVYVHCTRVLRDLLDHETARTTQAEGAALSLKDALDAELVRSGTPAITDPAH